MARLMYTPHPQGNQLKAVIAGHYVDAPGHEYAVEYVELAAMKRDVTRLADLAEGFEPHLVLFFATGGIPYVFPAMHILSDGRHRRDLTDGARFHMLPGLAWEGHLQIPTGPRPKEYFQQEIVPLLKQLLSVNRTVRVLLFDTTNSGNAVNLAIAAISDAGKCAGSTPSTLSVKVVGVVDATRARERRKDGERRLCVHSGREILRLFLPEGWRPRGIVRAGQWASFLPVSGTAPCKLSVSYWVSERIVTEDKAELIGADALHSNLRVDTNTVAGRITIQFSNSMSTTITGGGSVGHNFINLLSGNWRSCRWKLLKRCERMQLTASERRRYRRTKPYSDVGLRMAELLLLSDSEEAWQAFEARGGFLSPEELYSLLSMRMPFSPRMRRVIAASTQKNPNAKVKKYLAAFRDARLELVKREPKGKMDDCLSWWVDGVKNGAV